MADKSYAYKNDERFLYLESETREIIIETRTSEKYDCVLRVALCRVFETAINSPEQAFDELVTWLKKYSAEGPTKQACVAQKEKK